MSIVVSTQKAEAKRTASNSRQPVLHIKIPCQTTKMLPGMEVHICNASTGEVKAGSKARKVRATTYQASKGSPYADSSVLLLLLTTGPVREGQSEMRRQHGGSPGMGTMTKAQKDTH